jgi:hypothetical protein
MPRSNRDRARRYRDQAGRFLELAEMENRPQARDRLLRLAIEYGELAGHVSRHKVQDAGPVAAVAGSRNG